MNEESLCCLPLISKGEHKRSKEEKTHPAVPSNAGLHPDLFFKEREHKRSREIEVTQTILFEKNLENGLLTEEFFQVNPRHVAMACFSTVGCKCGYNH